MALGPVVATALTTHAARPYSLTIDGLELLSLPGAAYGVDRESIHLTEAGPGAISSLTCTIWDPGLEVALAESQTVRFWDHVADVPLFAGFIQSWAYSPATVGRYIQVRCTGIEAVLDWLMVPSSTVMEFDTGADYGEYIQRAYAACAGIGVPLNVAGAGSNSQRAFPIQFIGSTGIAAASIEITGMTLRSAIQALMTYRATLVPSDAYALSQFLAETNPVTVDFYGGLRFWSTVLGSQPEPTDYRATFTVTDTVAGALAATDVQHETDATGAIHQVYVKGANAAGSGLFSDGTGIPGPTGILNTDDTTAADAQGSALLYLSTRSAAVRGSFRLEHYTNPSTPSQQARPGTVVTITDAQAGLSGYADVVTSIDKTFDGTGETWTVAYGGLPKSAVRTNRRLTSDFRF